MPICQKNISKICDFHFSEIDLHTDIILEAYYRNIQIHTFFVHFAQAVSCYFFPACASLLWSLLSPPRCSLPTAAPLGTAKATGNCSLSFSTNVRVALAQNAHPDSLHWDHRPGETPRGDTTGRYNGETQRGKKTGKQNGETKWMF